MLNMLIMLNMLNKHFNSENAALRDQNNVVLLGVLIPHSAARKVLIKIW